VTDSNAVDLNKAWEQSWPAPAKINRFLHIVGQRDDGFHLLQSVFQLIDFCDYLKFSPVNNKSVTLTESIESVEDKDNLVIKAALLLQSHCQIESGVNISIDKNLPMGAGLGGGSSDAATTLLALNLLWNCQLSIQELSKIGLKLGADVAFFLKGKNAFVEGIGEKVTPISIDCPYLLLAIPNTHISTKEIFSSPDLVRNTEIISIKHLLELETNQQQQLILNNYGRNDCETVVLNQYPAVKLAFNQMKRRSTPHLTGTGSCFFSIYDNQHDAIKATPNNSTDIQFMVKKTLSESPILCVLKKFTHIFADNKK
jgi:4-diphosphocytidyl-2-C-methyl-D-erythritol kinase